jgi:FkbM family methyltransferase
MELMKRLWIRFTQQNRKILVVDRRFIREHTSGLRIATFWFLCKHNKVFKLYSFLIRKRYSFAINRIDVNISEKFRGVQGEKFYVEIGANDGVSQSNTKYLELYDGWKGVLIEPIPSAFEKLQKNRAAYNFFENSACCSFEFTSPYMSLMYANLMTVSLEGESDLPDRKQHAIIGAGSLDPADKIHNFSVKASTMNSILLKHGAPRVIDFLSLDVEGSEIEVLKGIDFHTFAFKYICVETRSFETIEKFLATYEYKFIEKLTSGISHSDYLFRYVGNFLNR